MQIRTADAPEVADDLLSRLASGPWVVFVGAFVSSRGPASLPMAAPLKEAIAHEMWSRGAPHLPTECGRARSRVLSGSRFGDVPLELLVEEVHRKADVPIDGMLGWLADAQPNINHRVLAALSDRGMAEVATTNFDELIEVSSDHPERIFKVHGTVSDPESMIVRLVQVGRGLVDRRFRLALAELLEGKSVCFLGYAGRDPDIFPLLGSIGIRQILWVARPAAPGADSCALEQELAHLRRLERVVDSLECVSVDADSLFESLAVRLSIGGGGEGPAFDWRAGLSTGCSASSPQAAALAFGRILGASGLWEQAAAVYTHLAGRARGPLGRDAQLYAAEARYYLDDYESARTYARGAARVYRQAGDRLGEARACQILGLIAGRSVASRSRAWSLRYMRRVGELASSDPGDEARALIVNNSLNLGTWLKNKGRLDGAEATLKNGLHLARGAGDIRAQQKIHLALAIVLRRRLQACLSAGTPHARVSRAARAHLGRARELAAYVGSTSEEVRVLLTEINLALDSIGYLRGASARAKRLIERSATLVASSSEPAQRGRLAEMRGIVLSREDDPRGAVDAFTEALQFVTTNTAMASCLRGRASAHHLLGDHADAWSDLRAALRLAPSGPEGEESRRLEREMAGHGSSTSTASRA